MWSIMSNIFSLLENFVDKYGLVIGSKYHSSNMNDAYTMSPYDIVSCHAKIVWLTTFFSNSKHVFVQLFCWLSAGQPGVDSWSIFEI